MAKMLVAGESVDSESGQTTEVRNPATGEVVDSVPKGTVNDIRRAIDTARVLAMDAVEKAGNGHPGTAMSLAPAAYTKAAQLADRVVDEVEAAVRDAVPDEPKRHGPKQQDVEDDCPEARTSRHAGTLPASTASAYTRTSSRCVT